MSGKPIGVVRALLPLASLALALAVSSAAFAGVAGTSSVSVPAGVPFTSSGVTLATGQSALITARGTISYGSQNPACAGSAIPPSGCAAEAICPVQGGCGALVGRVGNGPPFLVGVRKTVAGPGLLWLGINDLEGAFGDNSGAFTVTITTSTAGARSSPPGTMVATVLRVNGAGRSWVRDSSGRLSTLLPGTKLSLGDTIVTGEGTTVSIEFTIGGRAGVRPGSTVLVVSERTVDDASPDPSKAVMRAFDIYGLYRNANTSRQPVEIQTNGGVIGIKG